MKVLCIFGQHNYGDPKRGLGYEYTNFFPALKNLGHKVLFFESLDKSCYNDFSDMNRQLLQTVEQEKPELIFFVLVTYEIWLETLQLIREGSDAALIHWATDDSWKYEQFSRFMAPAFDIYATTYPSAIHKAEADGHKNFILTQWAANSDVTNEPLSASQCRYQVSFIGSAYGNRIKWVKKLKDRGIKINCFGHGWPNGSIQAKDIQNIICESVISLNFSDSGLIMRGIVPHRSRQIKARVFEITGAGGLLMTENAEHLEDYFTAGMEMIVFGGINDLVEKIKYLIANPEKRDAIARAGFSRTQKEHTYEARFKPLLELAINQRNLRGKSASNIDFSQFDYLAEAHRSGILLKVLKTMLLIPCTLVWGKQRGPRAARRILYEVCWRIFGRKTYMAKGLPGRLFYKES